MDPADLSIEGLGRAYRDGSLRPSEALDAVLERAERWIPRIHPFTLYAPEQARRAAAEADRRLRAGRPRGLLDGIPVTLKENIATAGDAYRMGTAATPPVRSPADAPVATRLREAGAVIFAKTAMPDFGMLSSGVSSLNETVRNPWNPDWNPGGSSAGAAAAAAAGIGPVHLGTDIGGSIRLPAGWCGVAGFKPSFGRVPVVPPYYARCAGPLARSVQDLAATMAIVSLPDPRDHMSLPYATLEWSEIEPTALDGLRVTVCRDAGTGLAPTPDVLAVLDDAARALQAAGAEVDATGPLIDDAMLAGLDRFWRMRSFLELRALGPEAAARALPDIRAWAGAAERYGAEEVFTGFSMMDAMAVAAAEAMRACDLLISPVAPIATFSAELAGPIGPERPFDHIGFTVPFSMSGHPAASVPWGVAGDGRPIGLQLVGHRHRDLEVLAAARACELLRPPQRPFPVG